MNTRGNQTKIGNGILIMCMKRLNVNNVYMLRVVAWQNTKCLFVKWGTETTNVNNVLAPKFFTFEVSYLKMDTPFTWL